MIRRTDKPRAQGTPERQLDSDTGMTRRKGLSADEEFLRTTREETRAILAAAIGTDRDVALLDVPNQRNVGDALIWGGEVEYFRSLGLRVKYVSDLRYYDPAHLRRAMPEGIVLIHGGGNFGDLWLGHQQHREQIVRDLPDYPIVQLPQSVYFADSRRASEANVALRDHPNFLLLLREADSQTRAADQLPDLRQQFCYDMALGLEQLDMRYAHQTQGKVLVLARRDKERQFDLASLAVEASLGGDNHVTDWQPAGLSGLRWRCSRATTRMIGRSQRALGARSTMPITNAGLRAALWSINRASISGGASTYRGARLALVDRLHAHVLAGLLGVEHIVMDNSYGKVRAVFDAYTGAFSTAHFAASPDEAREILDTVGRLT